LIQLGRRDLRHRLRHLQQTGIAHSKYFTHCHVASVGVCRYARCIGGIERMDISA
jgi:hypothetical protein